MASLTPEMWLKFLQSTELTVVRFPTIQLNQVLDPTVPVGVVPADGSPEIFEPDVRISRHLEAAFIHALVPVRIRCTTDDGTGRLALEINLTGQLIYQVAPDQAEPDSLVLAQFKKQAVFNLWPFLRQIVDDLLLKAGIRAPLLPLLLSPPQYATSDFAPQSTPLSRTKRRKS